jgi:CheY-like chemotaxis protein
MKQGRTQIPDGRIRVLIAGKDDDDRQSLADALVGGGCEVLFAANSHEALRRILVEWPSVIVLDLDAQEMDWAELVKARAESRLLAGIRVIVTAGGLAHLVGDALLPRPFRPDTVLGMVRSLANDADPVGRPPSGTLPWSGGARDAN